MEKEHENVNFMGHGQFNVTYKTNYIEL